MFPLCFPGLNAIGKCLSSLLPLWLPDGAGNLPGKLGYGVGTVLPVHDTTCGARLEVASSCGANMLGFATVVLANPRAFPQCDEVT